MDLQQNDIFELRDIWVQLGAEKHRSFIEKYKDITLLLQVIINEQMIKVASLFWDPSYYFFTFNEKDLTMTIKEYLALVSIELPNLDKICYKEPKKSRYQKKFAQPMQISIEAVNQKIKKKGGSDYIPWDFL
ncbi:hypothetical protein CRYUN_Cryun15aG0058000 [Craigia yunnanensis]